MHKVVPFVVEGRVYYEMVLTPAYYTTSKFERFTGIIGVAMVGSMYSKGNFNDHINSYGLVIMDECHHCGSTTSVEVMQKVNARYVYGVTATPKRGDNLEKIIHMLLGPIRHSYTAKERAEAQGIGHYVFPRFTRVIDTNETKNDINGAYNLISNNIVRSEMIAEDTRNAIAEGRTPVILTRYKEQAKHLYDNLAEAADYVFFLQFLNILLIADKIIEIFPYVKSTFVITGQDPKRDSKLNAREISVTGYLNEDNTLTVYADSQVRYDIEPSSDSLKELRDDLLEKEIVILKDGKYVFAQNYTFGSPSASVDFIIGGSNNGWQYWKDGSGLPINETLRD